MKRLGCSCLQSNTVTIEVSAVKVSNRILVSFKANIKSSILKAYRLVYTCIVPVIIICLNICSGFIFI